METTYLVTPTNLLNLFILKSDREYFSRPIPVVLHSEVSTHQLFATDPHRGHTYPINPRHIVAEYQLSKRQRRAA